MNRHWNSYLNQTLSRRDLLQRVERRLRQPRARRAARRRSRRAPLQRRDPLAVKAAALPAAGQARHLPVHARRAVAGRHVRLQAAARSATTASRCRSRGRKVVSSETGNLLQSPWKFRQYGQSGAWVSELFPEVAKCVDDLCFIHSMHGSNSRHGGALLELHTGSDTFVRPSMGSWITYGLGTENQTCPASSPSARR